MTNFTRILNTTEQEDTQAADELFPLVYEELRLLSRWSGSEYNFPKGRYSYLTFSTCPNRGFSINIILSTIKGLTDLGNMVTYTKKNVFIR